MQKDSKQEWIKLNENYQFFNSINSINNPLTLLSLLYNKLL